MELQQLREILGNGLMGDAHTRYSHHEVGDCRPLREWRRSSIPEWRSTLKRSIQSGDRIREEYARWKPVDAATVDVTPKPAEVAKAVKQALGLSNYNIES